MTIDPAALERIADRSWPAAHPGRLGDWIVNTDRGFSGRLNACWPLGDPGLPLVEAVDAVEARYAAAGLPSLFKPVDGLSPALEVELARRGYAPRTETLMMTGPLRGEGGRAEVTADPDHRFEAVFNGAQGDPEDAAERMGAFRRIPTPRGFAVVAIDGAPVAIGGTAIEGDWAGVFGMRTLAAHRRKGLARDILQALFATARAAGASRGYLQVEADNVPAIALYAGFGFREAYRYRYWGR
jgi:ribosomal protein S18 acetylase RimI-like enzyme